MRWKKLESIEGLEEVVKLSETQPVLLFKHSTRCGVSRMALSGLEKDWKDEDEQKIAPYFLDLLNHRDVSNEIAKRFGVEHESPQALVIRNGKCSYFSNHADIEHAAILAEIK